MPQFLITAPPTLTAEPDAPQKQKSAKPIDLSGLNVTFEGESQKQIDLSGLNVTFEEALPSGVEAEEPSLDDLRKWSTERLKEVGGRAVAPSLVEESQRIFEEPRPELKRRMLAEHQQRLARGEFQEVERFRMARDLHEQIQRMDQNVLTALESGAEVPFLRYLQQAGTLNEVRKAVNKFGRGETLSEGERAVAEAYAANVQAASLYDPSWSVKIAQIVGAQPTFWAEFLAMGPVAALGRKAAVVGLERFGVQKAAERFGAELTLKGLQGLGAREVTKRLLGTGAVVAVGELARAGGIPMYMPGTVERMIPGVTIADGPEGQQLALDLDQSQPDGFLSAFARSFGETAVETISERTGGAFGLLKAKILGKWLKRRGFQTVNDAAARLAKRIGWNGVVEEVFEEEIAKPFHNMLNDRPVLEGFLDPQEVATELVAFGLTGMVGGKLRNRYNRTSRYVERKMSDEPTLVAQRGQIQARLKDPTLEQELATPLREELDAINEELGKRRYIEPPPVPTERERMAATLTRQRLPGLGAEIVQEPSPEAMGLREARHRAKLRVENLETERLDDERKARMHPRFQEAIAAQEAKPPAERYREELERAEAKRRAEQERQSELARLQLQPKRPYEEPPTVLRVEVEPEPDQRIVRVVEPNLDEWLSRPQNAQEEFEAEVQQAREEIEAGRRDRALAIVRVMIEEERQRREELQALADAAEREEEQIRKQTAPQMAVHDFRRVRPELDSSPKRTQVDASEQRMDELKRLAEAAEREEEQIIRERGFRYVGRRRREEEPVVVAPPTEGAVVPPPSPTGPVSVQAPTAPPPSRAKEEIAAAPPPTLAERLATLRAEQTELKRRRLRAGPASDPQQVKELDQRIEENAKLIEELEGKTPLTFLPRYSEMVPSGTAYQADSGPMESGTAASVVRIEQAREGVSIPAPSDLLEALAFYPARAVRWVSDSTEVAGVYGGVKAELSPEAVVIASDGRGSYLIFDPAGGTAVQAPSGIVAPEPLGEATGVPEREVEARRIVEEADYHFVTIQDMFGQGPDRVLFKVGDATVSLPVDNLTVEAVKARAQRVLDDVAGIKAQPLRELPKADPGTVTEFGGYTVVWGNRGFVKTPQGKKAEFQWVALPVDAVQSSFNVRTGAIEPDYPKPFQPRDTSRVATQDEINRRTTAGAGQLDFHMMFHSSLAGDGAPMLITAQAHLPRPFDSLTRNHGKGILEYLYDQNSPIAQTYREDMLGALPEVGMESQRETVSAMPQVMLARVILTPMTEKELVAFAEDANKPSQKIMSPSEQARQDASRISNDMMAALKPSEEGELFTTENEPFLRAFFQGVLSDNERTQLMTATGDVSSVGIIRVRNAVFAKAYPEATELLEALTEDPEGNIRNIVSGMVGAANQYAVLHNEIEKGTTHNLSIARELNDAAHKLSELRRNKKFVEDYLNTPIVPGHPDLSPLARDILRMYHEHARSSRAIRMFLVDYAKEALRLGGALQRGMFGEVPPPSREGLWQGTAVRVQAILDEEAAEKKTKKDKTDVEPPPAPGETGPPTVTAPPVTPPAATAPEVKPEAVLEEEEPEALPEPKRKGRKVAAKPGEVTPPPVPQGVEPLKGHWRLYSFTPEAGIYHVRDFNLKWTKQFGQRFAEDVKQSIAPQLLIDDKGVVLAQSESWGERAQSLREAEPVEILDALEPRKDPLVASAENDYLTYRYRPFEDESSQAVYYDAYANLIAHETKHSELRRLTGDEAIPDSLRRIAGNRLLELGPEPITSPPTAQALARRRVPPPPSMVFPGMEGAVAEQGRMAASETERRAIEERLAEQRTLEAGRPITESPLFRGTSAAPQGEMFAVQLPPTEPDRGSILVERAIEAFGTSEDIHQAGYILPNGQMLDFKRRTFNAKDHEEILEVYAYPDEELIEPKKAIEDFQRQTGAIRVTTVERRRGKVGAIGFQAFLGHLPTEAQRQRLSEILDSSAKANKPIDLVVDVFGYGEQAPMVASFEVHEAIPRDLDRAIGTLRQLASGRERIEPPPTERVAPPPTDYRSMVEEAGERFEGIQRGIPEFEIENQLTITERSTGSTFYVPVSEASVERIREKAEEVRQRFAQPQALRVPTLGPRDALRMVLPNHGVDTVELEGLGRNERLTLTGPRLNEAEQQTLVSTLRKQGYELVGQTDFAAIWWNSKQAARLEVQLMPTGAPRALREPLPDIRAASFDFDGGSAEIFVSRETASASFINVALEAEDGRTSQMPIFLTEPLWGLPERVGVRLRFTAGGVVSPELHSRIREAIETFVLAPVRMQMRTEMTWRYQNLPTISGKPSASPLLDDADRLNADELKSLQDSVAFQEITAAIQQATAILAEGMASIDLRSISRSVDLGELGSGIIRYGVLGADSGTLGLYVPNPSRPAGSREASIFINPLPLNRLSNSAQLRRQIIYAIEHEILHDLFEHGASMDAAMLEVQEQIREYEQKADDILRRAYDPRATGKIREDLGQAVEVYRRVDRRIPRMGIWGQRLSDRPQQPQRPDQARPAGGVPTSGTRGIREHPGDRGRERVHRGRPPVERWQWLRNAEGDQSAGNRQAIYELDEFYFQRFIRPKLRPGYAETLADYQAKHPDMTHISLVQVAGEGPLTYDRTGSLKSLRPHDEQIKWAKRVASFDSTEAKDWAALSDTEVYRAEAAERGEGPHAPAGIQAPRRPGAVAQPAARPEGAGEAGGRRGGVRGRRGVGLDDVKPVRVDEQVRRTNAPVRELEEWKAALRDANVSAEALPPPTQNLSPDVMRKMKYEGQPEIVQAMLSELVDGSGGFLLASSTGSGKSFTGSAVLAELQKRGMLNYGLIVVPNQELANIWTDVLAYYGVPAEKFPSGVTAPPEKGVWIVTHSTLGSRSTFDRMKKLTDGGIAEFPWDVVIVDEADMGRKHQLSLRGQTLRRLGQKSSKVIYATATPLHSAVEVGYLEKLGLWRYMGWDTFVKQFPGVHLDDFGNYEGGHNPHMLAKLRQQLIARGQMVTMRPSYQGYSVNFGMVEITPEVMDGVRRIQQAFKLAENYFKAGRQMRMVRLTKAHTVTFMKDYLERMRLKQVIELAKKADAQGYKVGFFAGRRSERTEIYPFLQKVDEALGRRISAIMPPLPGVVETLREAFGDDLANFSGGDSPERSQELKDFQSGKKKHIFATYDAGSRGVGMHDMVGDAPRLAIFIGPPWSAFQLDQAMGRFWRFGTKSNAQAIILTSNARPEFENVVAKVGPRLQSLDAAVRGFDQTNPVVKGYLNMDRFLVFEQGLNERIDPEEFSDVVTGQGAISNWGQIGIPDAANLKNKGIQVRERVTGPPSLLGGGMRMGVVPDPELVQAMLFRLRNKFKRAFGDAYIPPPPNEQTEEDRAVEEVLTPEARARVQEVFPSAEERELFFEAADTVAEIQAEAGDHGDDPRPPYVDSMRSSVASAGGPQNPRKKGGGLARTPIAPFIMHGREIIRRRGDEYIAEYETTPGEIIADEMVPRYHIIEENINGPWANRFHDILEKYRPTKDEFTNAWYVGEGLELPMNEKATKLAAEITALDNEIGDRLVAEGVEIEEVHYDDRGGKRYKRYTYTPFRKLANHRPHMYQEDVLNIGSLRYQEAVRQTMKRYGVDRAEAERRINDRRGRPVKLAGNVERHRNRDIAGYETTPMAYFSYIEQAAEVLARKQVFGQRREKLTPIISRIPDQTDRRLITEIMDTLLAPEKLDPEIRKWLSGAYAFTIISKMFTSALPGMSDWARVAMHTSMRAYFGALKNLIVDYKSAERLARESGVLFQGMKQRIAEEWGVSQNLVDVWLEAIGYMKVDRFGRALADQATRIHLNSKVLPKLLKNPRHTFYRRHLNEVFKLSDEQIDAAIKRGHWTVADLNHAASAFSDKTQFTSDPTELPPAFRELGKTYTAQTLSAFFRLMILLKSNIFKQTYFLKDALILEAKKGNFRPWLPFLSIYPILGELMLDLLRLAQGDPERFASLFDDETWEPGNLLRRIAEDITLGAGQNILTVLMSMWERGLSALDYFAPSIAADIATLLETIYRSATDMVDGELEQAGTRFLKWLRRRGPLPKLLIDRTGLLEEEDEGVPTVAPPPTETIAPPPVPF